MRTFDLRRFANGIETHRKVVEAGLRLLWANGPVEGTIAKLKLINGWERAALEARCQPTIRRQGYARVKIDLLRRRLLAA